MFNLLFLSFAILVCSRAIQYVVKKVNKKPSKLLLQAEGVFIVASLSIFIYSIFYFKNIH